MDCCLLDGNKYTTRERESERTVSKTVFKPKYKQIKQQQPRNYMYMQKFIWASFDDAGEESLLVLLVGIRLVYLLCHIVVVLDVCPRPAWPLRVFFCFLSILSAHNEMFSFSMNMNLLEDQVSLNSSTKYKSWSFPSQFHCYWFVNYMINQIVFDPSIK